MRAGARRGSCRGTYAAIVPGYHLNKRHWLTVTCGGDAPDELVRELVGGSHDLVAARLADRLALVDFGVTVLPDPPFSRWLELIQLAEQPRLRLRVDVRLARPLAGVGADARASRRARPRRSSSATS